MSLLTIISRSVGAILAFLCTLLACVAAVGLLVQLWNGASVLLGPVVGAVGLVGPFFVRYGLVGGTDASWVPSRRRVFLGGVTALLIACAYLLLVLWRATWEDIVVVGVATIVVFPSLGAIVVVATDWPVGLGGGRIKTILLATAVAFGAAPLPLAVFEIPGFLIHATAMSLGVEGPHISLPDASLQIYAATAAATYASWRGLRRRRTA